MSSLGEVLEASPYMHVIKTALKEEGKLEEAEELYQAVLLGEITLDRFWDGCKELLDDSALKELIDVVRLRPSKRLAADAPLHSPR